MGLIYIPEALERFRKKIESFTPITDDDFMLFANIMHEDSFSKGEVLLKEGQVCRRFYFICSGCIRCFSLEEGRELNLKFYFEDDLASDFTSFRSEEPSKFYLAAMEDTIVYYATKKDWMQIFQSGASFAMFLFRFFQQSYLEEEEHSNIFKLMSPEDRYNFILQHKPEYLQRIPLIHLASYLGMSRETLTRVRRKI